MAVKQWPFIVEFLFKRFGGLILASVCRIVLWVCCLLCFPFLREILALFMECCQWEKCKEKTYRVFAPKAYSKDLMLIMLLLSFI